MSDKKNQFMTDVNILTIFVNVIYEWSCNICELVKSIAVKHIGGYVNLAIGKRKPNSYSITSCVTLTFYYKLKRLSIILLYFMLITLEYLNVADE